MNITPIKKSKFDCVHSPANKEYINKIQSEIEALEKKLFDNDTPTIETLTNDNFSEKEDLYQIIMRERKEFCELEKVRKAQCEKFKETQLRCKQLEIDNSELKNNMEILNEEKREQAEKIKELQREIDMLRREKAKKIQYKNDQLAHSFTNKKNNIKYQFSNNSNFK